MLFSFAASAQTEQEYVYKNIPKPENNTYRYVVVSGISKSMKWGEYIFSAIEDVVNQMKSMQAERFSLPTDSISITFLANDAKEISYNKVYVVRMFAEVIKDGHFCLHLLCLAPESEKVIFDINNMPESDYEKWSTTNLELIKEFRKEHENYLINPQPIKF